MTEVKTDEMQDVLPQLVNEAAQQRNQENYDELLYAVQEALEQRLSIGDSQNRLAEKLGLTGSYISNIRSGRQQPKYSTLVDMAVALGCHDAWRMAKSENINSILSLCHDAQVNSRLLMVAAETGSGKTTGLEYYTNKNSKVGYMLCTAVMNAHDFLNAVGGAMGRNPKGTLNQKLTYLCGHFKDNPKSLLILDDFGKLPTGTMLMVQIIRDMMREQVGIVLAGTLQMRASIVRKTELGVKGFEELNSRIGYCLTLKRPSADIIREICLLNGVDNTEAITHIQNRGKDFRVVRELITNAKRLRSVRGVADVTVKMLEEAAVS